MFQSPWNHHHTQKLYPPHVSKEGKTCDFWISLKMGCEHFWLGERLIPNCIDSYLKKERNDKSYVLLSATTPSKQKQSESYWILGLVLVENMSLLINSSRLRIWLSPKLGKHNGSSNILRRSLCPTQCQENHLLISKLFRRHLSTCRIMCKDKTMPEKETSKVWNREPSSFTDTNDILNISVLLSLIVLFKKMSKCYANTKQFNVTFISHIFLVI